MLEIHKLHLKLGGKIGSEENGIENLERIQSELMSQSEIPLGSKSFHLCFCGLFEGGVQLKP